ncbi:ABC-type branched-chain amino acid transport system permease component [Gaiella occulta]|uniref:ABC-type branched-chain amino acid transport system permease component n=1 Tax=Gaiella occulta TaxID=1002870 RepID=A0A7M2YU65_9ACTN|nr:branched-chain amino acid ABC transporter permease [Gaiella occulta]RDI73434.1 ABC-type branched-chain amino acid transport system permease component [Gaiella occulta]
MSSVAERMRAVAAERRRDLGIVAALIVLALLYPTVVGSLQSLPLVGDFVPSVDSMVNMVVFTTMAVGLNIVVGYAGLLDLGYVAFYAAGAYTAGWLASSQFSQLDAHLGDVGFSTGTPGIHVSMWLVLVIAGIFTTVVGIAIGLPTLRLRGDYLAIMTLGFGEIIPQFVRNGDSIGGFNLTNGTFGISPIDSLGFGGIGDAIGLPDSFRQSAERSQWFFWTAVAILLVTVFCSVRLRDSRLGRAWVAIREDETAAGAMGIPLMRTKTWAYALGAFFGGVAGAFYASFKAGAFPADFFFNISVFLLTMVILGGMGSVWGVILGGMVLGYLNVEGLATIGSKIQDAGVNFDPTKYQFGIYGVIIVLMMLFRPAGLIPERRHKIELIEGVHDTPFYDVQREGTLTDRDASDD